MKRFLVIVTLPFLASWLFGWGAFPIVCGLYFVGIFSLAILRWCGIKLIPDSAWGPMPSHGFMNTSVNPATGLCMIGGMDTAGNAYGAGHRKA